MAPAATLVMRETFDWLKPSRLWRPDGRDLARPDAFRPQLLRFTTDGFVEDFLAAAAAPRPDTLAARVVPAPDGAEPDAAAPLKLFQPVHGRYYLVCASLCCRMPGFPDRVVATAEGERVFFVLRKRTATGEYGWTANGAGKGWRLAAVPRSLLPDEEPLPLFPVTTAAGRAIYFGYVPVASRETYDVPFDQSSATEGNDPRLEALEAFLQALDRIAAAPVAGSDERDRRMAVYLLLDLWEFFFTHVPAVALALRDATDVTGPGADLVDALERLHLTPTLTLRAALGDVARARETLRTLGDRALPTPFAGSPAYFLTSLATSAIRTELEDRVERALSDDRRPTVALGKLTRDEGDRFALRCVYRRPQCDPPRAWVSEASEAFDLAPFFDPDAPARRIQIGLPEDTSIAGLRKFKKGMAIAISKQLRDQMSDPRVKIGPIGVPEGPNIDMICSLSIPIVTVCAFILLMIMVNILEYVFRWLPYFHICLPLKPGTKA